VVSSRTAARSQEVISRFEDAAALLPEDLRREVREKMHEFAGRRLAVLSRRKRFPARLLAALGRLATAVVYRDNALPKGGDTMKLELARPG